MPDFSRHMYEAVLTTDDTAFLCKYYPEEQPKPKAPDKHEPPRDIATLTIPEAAVLLNMTRNGAYKKIVESGHFDTVRKVGSPRKPVYLVSAREVKEYAVEHGKT